MNAYQIHISKNNETQILDVTKNEITIGKKIDSDIYLDHPSVSRNHAVLILHDTQWIIQDLGSKNGTFLNDKKIKKSGLNSTDVLRIANSQLKIHTVPKNLSQKESISETLKKGLEGTPLLCIPEQTLKERLSTKLGLLLEKNQVSFSSPTEKESYISKQLQEILGLGFLETYLEDPAISEIMINGIRDIYIEKEGLLQKVHESLSSESVLFNIIDRILSPLGRHVDEISPLVDARLPDGSRIHVVLPPISLNGPMVTIRKFSPSFITLSDLIRTQSLTEEIANVLRTLILERKSILISGGTSSGKTTLLNVLANCISPSERLITIEDSAELKLHQPHTIRLESRPPNIENKGQITIRTLVQNALRMRPDRIIIGECRGAETFDMLQAMNTGHEGCLSTCHSNSPRDTLKRLENMVMMAGFSLPLAAIREQITSAIHFIVQTKRKPNGQRVITHITKMCGMDKDTILTHDIFNSTKGTPNDIESPSHDISRNS